jgi:hypothetical protein
MSNIIFIQSLFYIKYLRQPIEIEELMSFASQQIKGNLISLYKLIDSEFNSWKRKKNSQTAEMCSQLLSTIASLIDSTDTNSWMTFLLLILKKKFTIDEVKKCFRSFTQKDAEISKREIAERREAAFLDIQTIMRTLYGMLEKKEMDEYIKANPEKVNVKEIMEQVKTSIKSCETEVAEAQKVKVEELEKEVAEAQKVKEEEHEKEVKKEQDIVTKYIH